VLCQKKRFNVLIFVKRVNRNLREDLAFEKRGRKQFVLTGLADMLEA
jgi:hypothetical protein